MGAKVLKSPTGELTFAAGSVLFEEGDPGGELWLVRAGSVEVYRTRQGRRFHLARIGEGEMLGSMTALSGGARTASVRALTEVKVVVIKREQVAKLTTDLPSWATALIRDLVARVSYANALYIDSGPGASAGIAGPLGLSAQLAETASSFADVLAHKDGDEDVVDMRAGLEKIARLLGHKAELSAIVDIFLAEGLLVAANNRGGGLIVTANSVAELKTFATLMGELASRQSDQNTITIPFAVGERRSLSHLAAFGATHCKTPGQKAVLPLSMVEDEFHRQSHLELKPYLLNMAQNWNLITTDKSGAEPTVTFDPHYVAYAMRSFEAAVAINASAAQASTTRKKALDY